ncbi:MAG: AIR synthase-related protein [Lachnospiraceae bacterium]
MKLITQKEQHLCETSTVYGQSEDIGNHALAAVANSLAAAGALCLGIGVKITYPSHVQKSNVYQIEKNIKKICSKRKIELLDSVISQNPFLPTVSVTVNGLGNAACEKLEETQKNCEDAEIVQTKWIGMDGMLQIAKEKEDELKGRFAPAFIRQILSHRQALFADKEIEVAKAMGVSVMRQITEGGIFAALWELAKESKKGLSIDMKKIAVLQETIEVCEHFRINPYQLTSVGSFLMVTDNGEVLADALLQEGIPASVIGRLTDSHDKVIKNGEDVRYIDRPAPDEIFKLYC